MNNVTAVFKQSPTVTKSMPLPTGRLLVNDSDEIIYANTQARHFLGLLSEESLPTGQKFLPLLSQSYQFYPTRAWLGWPKWPVPTTARYLIYTAPNSKNSSLLKVEANEKIVLEGKTIWAISIQLVESRAATAVSRYTV